MPPAFSSLRQASAFALLLLVVLLSPWLVGRWGLPSRDQIYSSMSWRTGGFPYIHQQIFQEKGDIDMAFIGSSHMGNDIDTPYVQQQLSAKLGRTATVISLSWVNSGLEADYIIARDLLAHRKVRLLVFYDDRGDNVPHLTGWRWFRFGDDAPELAGLPFHFQFTYYYGAILGLPRNLLNDLRPNLDLAPPAYLFHLRFPQADFIPERLGTFTSRAGYINRPDLFAPYTPTTSATPSDVVVYGPDTHDDFTFADTPAAPLQLHFAQKFLALARGHSTPLACLNLPTISNEHDASIHEGRLWLDVFQGSTPLLGIAPARLFAGLGEDDIRKLYQDPVHFNQNGQAYFTRLITPQLIDLYEQANP
jgi:hypothetical protein